MPETASQNTTRINRRLAWLTSLMMTRLSLKKDDKLRNFDTQSFKCRLCVHWCHPATSIDEKLPKVIQFVVAER